MKLLNPTAQSTQLHLATAIVKIGCFSRRLVASELKKVLTAERMRKCLASRGGFALGLHHAGAVAPNTYTRQICVTIIPPSMVTAGYFELDISIMIDGDAAGYSKVCK